MRAGLTTSVILHGAALAFCLVSLRAPPPLQVSDVEAVAVDIVPLEAVSQVQQGDKKAPMREKPAPTPTKRPDIVADARDVGENSVDTEKPITPEAKPKPVDNAASAPSAPTPVEKPRDEDVPKPTEKPRPAPATEVTPKPEPKQEVKPEPVRQAEPKPDPAPKPQPAPAPEPKPAKAEPQPQTKPDAVAEAIADAKPAEIELPDTAPVPVAKPQPRPAPAETAKAPDRKDSDKPVKEASSRPKSEDKALDDRIAALLNKEKASGGGAKRSTEQASLGGRKTTGNKLSKSEEDALRGQVEKCWNLPAGAEDAENLIVKVRFRLDRSGAVDGPIDIVSGGGAGGVERAAAESARRAVARCAPYNLPADKYEGGWDEVVINFDPRDMF